MNDALAARLTSAIAQIEHWTAERDSMIALAMNEGASAREVAALAGISHTWVLKIWKDQT